MTVRLVLRGAPRPSHGRRRSASTPRPAGEHRETYSRVFESLGGCSGKRLHSPRIRLELAGAILHGKSSEPRWSSPPPQIRFEVQRRLVAFAILRRFARG